MKAAKKTDRHSVSVMSMSEPMLTHLLSSFREPVLDTKSLSYLNEITQTEEIVSLLQRLDKAVADLPVNQGSLASEIMIFLAQNKLDLFLSANFTTKKSEIISLFSKEPTKKSKSLDQSVSPNSPLIILFEVIAEYGAKALSICAPLLQLPNELTTKCLKKFLETTQNELVNPIRSHNFSSVYRSLARSPDVLSRIVECLLDNQWIIYTDGNPLQLIWQELTVEQIPVILPLFRSDYLQTAEDSLLISTNEQLSLFDLLLTTNDLLAEKAIYSKFTFNPNLFTQTDVSQQHQVQETMLKHISSVLKKYGQNISDSPIESYDDDLLRCFNSVLSTEQTFQVSENIRMAVFDNPTGESFEILHAFLKFLKPFDFLTLLKSKLFKGYPSLAVADFYRYVHYKEKRASFILSWLRRFHVDLNREEKRAVMKYASSCNDEEIYCNIFQFMAINDPLEARFMEEDLVKYMKKTEKKTHWDSVCLLTFRNRGKFFGQFQEFSREYFKAIQTRQYTVEIINISHFYRCAPYDFVSTYYEELNWVKNAGLKFSEICLELSDVYKSKEEYKRLCSVYGDVLAVQHESVMRQAIHTPGKVEDLIKRAIPVIEAPIRVPIFRSMVVSILIRYGIRLDSDIAENLIDHPFMKFIYKTFVLTSPPDKNSIDIESIFDPDMKMEVCDFFTVLYYYESFTEKSQSSLKKFVDDQDPFFWKTARLAIRLKDAKKHEPEIVDLICSLYLREEIVGLGIETVRSLNFTRTSKLQISAHWFFVDEFEDILELDSFELCIGLCLDKTSAI
jgi:hypothetical protein